MTTTGSASSAAGTTGSLDFDNGGSSSSSASGGTTNGASAAGTTASGTRSNGTLPSNGCSCRIGSVSPWRDRAGFGAALVALLVFARRRQRLGESKA
jgi:MYXO-CTERM domain-containing protein